MKTPPTLIVLLAFLAFAPASFPAGENTPPRVISMRECVETALRANIDIAVSRVERDIAAFGVPIEGAAFLPKFTGDLSASRSHLPSGSVLNGSIVLDQRILTFNLGVQDLLPVGTTLSLDFENLRQDTGSAIALFSPQFSTALTLSARQPLLKNRGRQATEAPLAVARAGEAAKAGEWREKVMDVVAAAKSAFLSFSAAHSEAEVRRAALGLAEKLLEEIQARIDAGFAAPMDRLATDAAAAARREELIRAETLEQNALDNLKTVLGVRIPREWEERLLPAPLPGAVEPPGERDTFEEAVRLRPEVSSLAARRQQAEIQESAARNRTLPSLDLTVSAGLSGLAGSPNPNPLLPVPTTEISGNYGDSIDQMFSGRYYNWFVGLKTELPWRFDREKAEWARARAVLEEQRLLSDGLDLRILAEVRKGRRDLESALERIAASRASSAAAAIKLEAEEKKLALGASTAVEVLRFQQDRSEALLAEIRAHTDAHLAQTRLWRAVGTLLEKEGIVIR
ncbi:MAG TPA: TolC family protein [Candidatus Limnocylindrales bacterium]|nr:TolC family protein [Candidatus Limnocylindrales bacterium]